MGEFDLLRHVYQSNDRLDPLVLVPPGDDMAAIRLGESTLLAAVDQVIDGVHVDRTRVPVELIGRKAIARSVSDIAAMAGRPVASLVSVALPADFDDESAKRLFDAMRDAAEQMDCPLIGGDIASIAHLPDAPLSCSVTVLAEAVGGRFITRSGATPGDAVFVTGTLGGSLEEDGSGHHLTFTPRVAEALALLDALGDDLHAMIDISDGLGRDAGHLASQSGVRIELEAMRIPVTPGVELGRALADGEDYELCFAAAPDAAIPDLAGVTVTRIGRVVAYDDNIPLVTLRHADGSRAGANDLGWEHGR